VQQRWEADEGRSVVGPFADRVGEMGERFHRLDAKLERAEQLWRMRHPLQHVTKG